MLKPSHIRKGQASPRYLVTNSLESVSCYPSAPQVNVTLERRISTNSIKICPWKISLQYEGVENGRSRKKNSEQKFDYVPTSLLLGSQYS